MEEGGAWTIFLKNSSTRSAEQLLSRVHSIMAESRRLVYKRFIVLC